MSPTCLPRFAAARIFPSSLHFRIAAYRNTRSFSASATRRTNFVDIAVAGPMTILDGIHNLGVPWSVALPISAFLVRAVFAHFLSGRRARRRAQLQNSLLPLTLARLRQERTASWYSKGRKGSSKLTPREQFWDRLEFEWMRRRIQRKLAKDYRVSGGRLFGFLNFGILIAFTEAIRLKCGAREGLLPFLASMPSKVGETIVEMWRGAVGATGTKPANETTTDATAAVGIEKFDAARDQRFDPTMQTEGLPWITDLTSADPNVLPVILGFSIAGRTLLGAKPSKALQEQSSRDAESPDIERRIANALGGTGGVLRLGFAVIIMFASMKMPAAIPLYWVSSNVAGLVYGRWLDWKYPLRPAVMPCRRPLRRKVRSRS